MTKLFQGAKILTADIETLPLQTYNWSLFDEPRALDRVVQDWAIFSAAAKWLHEKRVQYLDTRDEVNATDDYELLQWLHALLDEADIVVGHNMARFDMRKIRARMIHYGMRPFREPVVVDTLLMQKEIGKFTSNRLEYQVNPADAVKSKHAKYPGFSLWLGIMNREIGAYDECKTYNKQDIITTEQRYLRLRPWTRRHPNVAQYYTDDLRRCPRCGSPELDETVLLHRGVSTYQAYSCQCCGGHSRSRFTLNTKDKRKSLITCI